MSPLIRFRKKISPRKANRSVLRFAPMVIFGVMLVFLFWLVGHRLNFANIDEGIYLDAAKRVAEGQSPYRDFFYLSGPGTPWIMGLCMKLLGVNLPAARLVLIVDISLMTMLVFWMTRRLSESSLAASATTLLFAAFSTMQPSMVVASHRWDSAAMGLAAIALTWLSHEQPQILPGAFAGLACAAATWTTPSFGLLAITLSFWFIVDKHLRATAIPFFCGAAGVILAGMGFLQSEGALSPMIDQFFWIAQNYSGANRMGYGQVIGGYGSLIHGSAGATQITVLVILIFVTVPAWLPPLSTIGWLCRLPNPLVNARKRFAIPFLLVCGAVLIIAQAPKLDLGHLIFPSPVYYSLAGALAAEYHRRRRCLILIAMVCFLAAGAAIRFTFSTRMNEVPTVTPMGTALMSPADSEWLRTLSSYVKGGDTLFVFPYMPSFYFILDAQNPTRYSFLQPGMSTESDEVRVLEDLRNNPPEWIIHSNVKPKDYLRIWPSSDPSRLRLPLIEQFIDGSYSDVVRVGPHRLKRYG